MTDAATKQQGFSGDEPAKLLALATESASEELRTTEPEYGQRSTIDGLGFDPLEARTFK